MVLISVVLTCTTLRSEEELTSLMLFQTDLEVQATKTLYRPPQISVCTSQFIVSALGSLPASCKRVRATMWVSRPPLSAVCIRT